MFWALWDNTYVSLFITLDFRIVFGGQFPILFSCFNLVFVHFILKLCRRTFCLNFVWRKRQVFPSHRDECLPNVACTFMLVAPFLLVLSCAASFHRSQALAHLPRVDTGAPSGSAYEWPKNHTIYRRVTVACWWPLLNRQPKWLPARDASLENTAIRMRRSTEAGSFLLPHPRPPGIYLDSQHGLVKPCIKWSHVKRLHMWCVYSLGWLGLFEIPLLQC